MHFHPTFSNDAHNELRQRSLDAATAHARRERAGEDARRWRRPRKAQEPCTCHPAPQPAPAPAS